MAKKYCVLIGDIVDSKKISNRKVFQARFSRILEKVNQRFAADIISEFTITLGDELQGVIRHPQKSYDIIEAFLNLFEPVELRFGIGLGAISTKISKKTQGMDGQAFHLARAAILRAKKEGQAVVFNLGKPLAELSLNTLCLCLQNISKAWTKRQKRVVEEYCSLGKQDKVARVLRVSQPTVAKILAASRYDWFFEVEAALKSVLSLIIDK